MKQLILSDDRMPLFDLRPDKEEERRLDYARYSGRSNSHQKEEDVNDANW